MVLCVVLSLHVLKPWHMFSPILRLIEVMIYTDQSRDQQDKKTATCSFACTDQKLKLTLRTNMVNSRYWWCYALAKPMNCCKMKKRHYLYFLCWHHVATWLSPAMSLDSWYLSPSIPAPSFQLYWLGLESKPPLAESSILETKALPYMVEKNHFLLSAFIPASLSVSWQGNLFLRLISWSS